MAAELIFAALALGAGALAIDRRASARARRAEAAYPPTGRMINIRGHRIHAHVEGSGPDLVLLHGASGNARDFTFSLAPRLAADFRVTAFDRPGLGWSDDIGPEGRGLAGQASILRAAIEELGIGRPILLGHSYGGALALAWAADSPQKVASLVLLGAPAMPWTGGLGLWYWLNRTRVGRALILPAVAALAPLKRAESIIDLIFAPDPVPPGYAAHVGPGLTLRRKVLATNVQQMNRLKAELAGLVPRYPGLALPVEIVHGSADTIVPPGIHALPLAQALPDAALTLLPGIGHMPHHADQDAVIAATLRAAARAGLR